MPIARKPVNRTDMFFPHIKVGPDGPFPVGAAVAVIRNGEELVYTLAGACDCVEAFCGFISGYFEPGYPATVTTVRGAVVSPLVENEVPLVPGRPVYLAVTLGTVTQTVPLVPASQIVRVGFAINSTEMMLVTDDRIENPG